MWPNGWLRSLPKQLFSSNQYAKPGPNRSAPRAGGPATGDLGADGSTHRCPSSCGGRGPVQTITGCGRYFKAQDPEIEIIPRRSALGSVTRCHAPGGHHAKSADTVGSPVDIGGRRGARETSIQILSTAAITVSDLDALRRCPAICCAWREVLGGYGSTGIHLAGALQYCPRPRRRDAQGSGRWWWISGAGGIFPPCTTRPWLYETRV